MTAGTPAHVGEPRPTGPWTMSSAGSIPSSRKIRSMRPEQDVVKSVLERVVNAAAPLAKKEPDEYTILKHRVHPIRQRACLSHSSST